ncbi:MAG: alpha/beta fold hydrolase, partial [Woeseiaceae bacterium]|nr:alpha/beta fold hydrolase [Woeseiaceae bacterium]NIP22199.1 alpha/beta fold hydrolase [Woeseiaceae bacterium]
MIRPILLTLAIVVIGLALMTFSLPGPAAEFAISIERYRTGLLPARIQVDGEPWHYLVGGPADGETVLLLHGFGANKDTWTRFAGYLTERYRVVAPDLPGFGESHRQPGQDYRLPAQRERLHAFVAALGLTDFHLAGNSMGGHLS